MKLAWNRLGTPDAISWVVVVLASVQIFAGSLTAPFVDITGRFAEFLGARMVSLLFALLVLAIGKWLLQKFATEHPRPAITLASFAFSTMLLSISMNWMLIVLDFTEEWNILQRIIISLPGFFAILVVSGLLSSYARESARRNEELAATATAFAATREQAAQRIQERKSSLLAAVKREVELSLGDIDAQSEATTALRSLIDDVVRPMSYQLSRERAPSNLVEVDVPETMPSWARILAQATQVNPAHPLATSTWLGLLLGSFLITGFGLLGFLATLVQVTLAFLTLGLIRWLWPLLPTHLPNLARVLIFSSSILLFTAFSTPLLKAITGYGFNTPTVFTGWFTLSLFITWTVTLVITVNESLRHTYAQLSSTVDELKREVIGLNNELRMLQKNISRVLHGPVQEAISASLARLQKTSPGSDISQLISDVQRRVSEALAAVDEPVHSQINLKQALDDLVELWDEVVQISISLDEQTKSRIEQDAYASSALLELVREACGNAIRHGQAKHIQVVVSLAAAQNAILINVENDGTALKLGQTAGLGSQIFDEMCLEWSRIQLANAVQVNALIPITR